MTQSDLKQLFAYDPLSGNLLWNVQRQRIRRGSVAGTVTFQNYRVINTQGEMYRAHHLVWLWHHGYLPKMLDHINGDPLDNRIENLRECDHQQNMVNRKIHKNNTSRYKGVRLDKTDGKWVAVAEYRTPGQNGSRQIGRYDTAEEAAIGYNLDAMKHYPEFSRLNKVDTPLGRILGMSET